jgi:hypothetical protein
MHVNVRSVRGSLKSASPGTEQKIAMSFGKNVGLGTMILRSGCVLLALADETSNCATDHKNNIRLAWVSRSCSEIRHFARNNTSKRRFPRHVSYIISGAVAHEALSAGRFHVQRKRRLNCSTAHFWSMTSSRSAECFMKHGASRASLELIDLICGLFETLQLARSACRGRVIWSSAKARLQWRY